MPQLKDTVEGAINEVEDEYRKEGNNKRSHKTYLTENDVVCRLYAKLSDKVGDGLTVHSELRPYTEGNKVIRDTEWKEQNGANTGAKIDLAIIDTNEAGYWTSAYKKAQKDQNGNGLKYWRILSYPVKAFRAAIEVKIKIRNNYDGLRRDKRRLKLIKKETSNCLTYMVVLDRCGPDTDTVKEILSEDGVKVHSVYGTTNGICNSPD